ncbi:MAG: hypothetical protein ABJB74_16000 [Gemmatimonas sp.]
MRILPGRWAVLASVVLLCSCAANAPRVTASRAQEPVVGCYRFSQGTWSSEAKLGPARATTVVRLDTVARPGETGALTAERVEPGEVLFPSDPRVPWQKPARWWRVGNDSIVISWWSTGTEAETFMGHRAGATLQGMVRRTNDQIFIDPETKKVRWDGRPFATASAIRVPCP